VGDHDEDLAGRFVAEVGIRQVWPFLTLCNAGAGGDELRLYIDTEFEVKPGSGLVVDDDMERLAALAGLLNLTVDRATVASDGELKLGFADGGVLAVSGVAASFTTHAPWWVARVWG
jgi:hypothetical protein